MPTRNATTVAAKEGVERQITLTKHGKNVFVLTLTGIPNRANVFDGRLVQRLIHLLDRVEEKEKGKGALILMGNGEFFSAGFDVKALTGAKSVSEQKRGKSRTPSRQGQQLVEQTWRVLARLLVFPVPTIAVFNGHAFGLGFFLGMACDHRLMITEDKPQPNSSKKKTFFLCLPEIHLGLPLGEGFAALAKCKLPINALRLSALTGKRWTAQQAKNYGIIDQIVTPPRPSTLSDAGAVPPQQALRLAEQLIVTSERGSLSSIKMELYGDAYKVLNQASSPSISRM